ncbi:MAG TPA: hypothetical protein PKW95_18685 [bacterium]|nr:hypothetical protein [bacterium]
MSEPQTTAKKPLPLGFVSLAIPLVNLLIFLILLGANFGSAFCFFLVFCAITLAAGIVAGFVGLRQRGGLRIAAIVGIIANAGTLLAMGWLVVLGLARF